MLRIGFLAVVAASASASEADGGPTESALTPGFDGGANQQRVTLTYLGYDHVLTYNLATHRVNAFDIRRNLVANDTCDYMVFPPVIKDIEMQDVMTAAADVQGTRGAIHLTYLGKEMFMMQNSATGEYEVRRCSGFMPQQKDLPCEVFNVGCNDMMKGNGRFFYAGKSNRVIKHDPSTGIFEIISYDSDIPGGTFPFKSVFSAEFAPYKGEVEFAVVQVNSQELLLALEVSSGSFKVWEYDSMALKLDGLIENLALSGTLDEGYHVKHMGANSLIVYHDSTGEFEVLQFERDEDNKVTVSSQKRDNLFYGHPCVFHTRGACVQASGCGWCEDSATCHHVGSERKACSGYNCLSFVDEFSPDWQKFAEKETNTKFEEFGIEDPNHSPSSDLRGTGPAFDSVPMNTQATVHDDDHLEFGLKVNAELGTVYIPPSPNADHGMDVDYVVPAKQEPWPTLTQSRDKMNEATPQRKVYELSPMGSAAKQLPPDIEEKEPTDVATVNVSTTGPCSEAKTPSLLTPETFIPINLPEAPPPSFAPANDGTVREEDLMNAIGSKYSSLAPKSTGMKANRDAEENQRSGPWTSTDYKRLPFKPADVDPALITVKPPSRPEVPVLEVPLALYDEDQMESGVSDSFTLRRQSPVSSVQGFAMANSRYKSDSIYSPATTDPRDTTREHRNDLTGRRSVTVHDRVMLDDFQKLRRSDAGQIVEGDAYEDKDVASEEKDIPVKIAEGGNLGCCVTYRVGPGGPADVCCVSFQEDIKEDDCVVLPSDEAGTKRDHHATKGCVQLKDDYDLLSLAQRLTPKVTSEEAMMNVVKEVATLSEAEIQQKFKDIDTDGDGKLNKEEIKVFFLGTLPDMKISDENVNAVLLAALGTDCCGAGVGLEDPHWTVSYESIIARARKVKAQLVGPPEHEPLTGDIRKLLMV